MRFKQVVLQRQVGDVAGYGRPTINGIKDFVRLDSLDAYETTATEGDGTVPHELGFLRTRSGETVKTYFVDTSHTNLPRDDRVVATIDELLERGTTEALSPRLTRFGPETSRASDEEAATASEVAEEERVRILAQQIRSQRVDPDVEGRIEPEEGELAEILMRSF